MKKKTMIAVALAAATLASVQGAQAQGFLRGRFFCAGGSCAQAQAGYSYAPRRVGFFGRGACFGGSCYGNGAAYYANAYTAYQNATSVPPCGQTGYCEEKVSVPGGCEGEYLPTQVETPAPCEAIQTVEEKTVEETVQPCAPVQACAPVAETPCNPCDPCANTECDKTSCPPCGQTTVYQNWSYRSNVGTCPNGACPLRTTAKAASNVARTAVAAPINGFLAAVNAVRAQYGLRALAADSSLTAGSSRQVTICASRQTLIHAGGVAEILAQNNTGYNTAIQQWLTSRMGHRELLLNPNFTRAGVATYRDGYGRVWCAVQFR